MILACFVLFGKVRTDLLLYYLAEVRTDTQYILAGVMGIWLAVWEKKSPETTFQGQISQETPGVVENVPDRNHFGGVSRLLVLWRMFLIVITLVGWVYEEKLSQSGCTDGWVVSPAWLCEAHLWPLCSLGWTWQGPPGSGLVVSLQNEWIPWRGNADGHIVFILHSREQKTVVGCTDEIEELMA